MQAPPICSLPSIEFKKTVTSYILHQFCSQQPQHTLESPSKMNLNLTLLGQTYKIAPMFGRRQVKTFLLFFQSSHRVYHSLLAPLQSLLDLHIPLSHES